MESQKDTTKLVIGQDLKVKKTEKLVTAIFMVSDLMDKAEPLRTELRSLSLKLLSGNHTSIISELVSLITISTSIGLVSDMNAGILVKELNNLKDTIPTIESLNLGSESVALPSPVFSRTISQGHIKGQDKRQNYNNHNMPAPYRSAGSDVGSVRLNKPTVLKTVTSNESKNDRRDTIIKLIKEKREVTIKDISSNISGCSEKTIQRELISMLKDKVLEKTGEKRWSKYFLSRNS